MLSGLRTKSLIRRSGGHRYDLHELIRQYAADRLADQPKVREDAQKRHALYYLEFFSGREAPLRSSAQHETVTELTAEMDNFRVAWDWSIIHHEFASFYRAARALWYLCELRTWFDEGELIFHKSAESIQSYADGNPEVLDMANEMRGYSAYHAYRQGKTFAAYDELMRVRAQLPPNAIRYVQLYLGIVSRDLGKFTEANEALQESLEKAEAYDDQWLRSMAGQFLGIIALEMGDPMLIAHALGFLSLTIQAVGETADAENFLQESLGLMQKIGYRWGVGNALHGLGILAQKSNPHEARKLFAAGSDIYREIGDLRSLTRALCHQGYNSLALDDIPDAQKSFTEALKLALQCDYTPYALEALVGFASLEIKQDDLQRAFELVLFVLNHPAGVQETKGRAAHLRAELEGQLTPQQLEAVQARMQANDFETAVHEVLEEAEPE